RPGCSGSHICAIRPAIWSSSGRRCRARRRWHEQGEVPMADYTLFCFAQSGNAYKAALMLAVTGSNWTPRFVDYFNGETRTTAYRAINVMGEVPVLEHGERRLAQSGVILDYLADKTGQFGA